MNLQEIQEDVLIVGGGPVGGFIAYIFAKKYNFTVRIIERLPDLNDPKVQYQDRSGNFSLSYRAAQVFEKYGLKYDFLNMVNFADSETFLLDDKETKMEFMPGKKLMFYPTARREVINLFNKLNKENENIIYEYETSVENIDFENNIIETTNKKNDKKLKRKFQFVIGTDGYRSMVRNSMDKQIIKDKELPEDTVLTKIEENLISTININLPNYSGYMKMKEEVKQGKYPWYDRLNDKYKKGYTKLCGKYIWDPTTLGEYGYQNLCGYVGPMNDGKMNIYIGILRNRNSIQNYLDNNPQYKNSWRINPNINVNAEDIQTDEDIHNFFEKHFPIFYGMCPDIIEQWKNTKVFSNYTVYCDNWYYKNQACLFGDACEGISYICGNSYNLALHNMDNFFKIIEQKTNGDLQQFLNNSCLRQEIFSQYQEQCFQYTRQVQVSDVSDSVFPSLVQAQHPKDALFQEVENILFQKCDRIYNNKINFQFSTNEDWNSVSKKSDLFRNYIVEKLENSDNIDDVDLTNCREDLIQLLEKNNLPIYYNIEPSIYRNL